MSIDYNRLREMVRAVENYTAYDPVEVYTASDELEVRAPALARELLRLRDEGSQLLAKKRAAVKRLYSTDQVTAAVLEGMCDELENLLEGDTE